MGKTPEQVRGVTVSPGQWGNGKDSSGVTRKRDSTVLGGKNRDGITFAGGNRDKIALDGFALAEETEMGSLLMDSL